MGFDLAQSEREGDGDRIGGKSTGRVPEQSSIGAAGVGGHTCEASNELTAMIDRRESAPGCLEPLGEQRRDPGRRTLVVAGQQERENVAQGAELELDGAASPNGIHGLHVGPGT